MIDKQARRIKQVESHLRRTARQLLKFDTEEEAVQYLTDSSQKQFRCDFVGVILKQDDFLIPKVWSGELKTLREAFPLHIEDCSPDLLEKSLKFSDEINSDCRFIQLLNKERVKTWFTVPLKDDQVTYGFCVIAYLKQTPLFDIRETFNEFGKDVAIAISLAKRKERQRKQYIGMEWITENLSLEYSIDKLTARVTKQAAKSVNANSAAIFLYDDKQSRFTFQPPSFGEMDKPEFIEVEENYELKEYFPYMETAGSNELTVPLLIDVQTVGVLHVEKRNGAEPFTEADSRTLRMQANYFASMLENIRLYEKEKQTKSRLKSLLDDHQELVKETIEQDHFHGITQKLSKMLQTDVILFDRFMRYISSHQINSTNTDFQLIQQVAKVMKERRGNHWQTAMEVEPHKEFQVFQISGGSDLLGFLVIDITSLDMDEVHYLTINFARNICSIQFIKEKLVLETKEQVKDSFIHQLLVEDLQNTEQILQYANVFQWDIFKEHRVAVMFIQEEKEEVDLIAKQSKKLFIRDLLKTKLAIYDKDILPALNEDLFILIVPAADDVQESQKKWSALVHKINEWLREAEIKGKVFIGVGGIASDLKHYYESYQQAMQTLNVMVSQGSKSGFAFFDQLGSYVLLHDLKESKTSSIFINEHLGKLIQYSKGKNVDLFHTLRVYLEQNGSIKNTADNLYIHRSTLLYRLEKIKELLDIDLEDSETRFNLMMAYKLYDLEDTSATF